MKVRQLLPAIFVLTAIVALILPGCDELVTERIENTVYDSTLGAGCFTCHSDDDNAFLRPKAQWANSKHASGAHIDTSTTCEGAKCHTHEGYISTFDDVIVPGPAYSAIGCFTCHSPHSYDYEIWSDTLLRKLRGANEGGFDTLANGVIYYLDDNDKSIMCVNCHKSVFAGSDPASGSTEPVLISEDFGPHFSPQADVLFGTGGYGFTDTTAVPSHKEAVENRNGCLACHYGTADGYRFGEHTFRLRDESDNTQYTVNCNVNGCHAAGQNGGIMADLESAASLATISTLADSLETLLKDQNILDSVGQVRTGLTFQPELVRMLFNYLLYIGDGSRGVHNPNYIRLLLTESIEQYATLPVVANFSADPTSVCVLEDIVFTNSSGGPVDSVIWDFGDTVITDTSAVFTFTHAYENAGSYNITLTAYGLGVGNISSLTMNNYITVTADPPVAGFTVNPADTTGDYPFIIFVTDTSTGGESRLWDFGDPAVEDDTSSILQPSYEYGAAGIFTVTLIVTNPCGADTATHNIIVTEPASPTAKASEAILGKE
jgi:PKD repeat protein